MDFTETLMDLKRRAALQGRPVSAREVSSVASPYFEQAANREAQLKSLDMRGREIDSRERIAMNSLAGQREMFDAGNALENIKTAMLLQSADKARRNQLVSNLLNSAGTAAGLYYLGAGK